MFCGWKICSWFVLNVEIGKWVVMMGLRGDNVVFSVVLVGRLVRLLVSVKLVGFFNGIMIVDGSKWVVFVSVMVV